MAYLCCRFSSVGLACFFDSLQGLDSTGSARLASHLEISVRKNGGSREVRIKISKNIYDENLKILAGSVGQNETCKLIKLGRCSSGSDEPALL